MNSDGRVARLQALQRAAAELADGSTALGRMARELLPQTCGLSEPGVDYALRECLEHGSGRAALTQLIRRAPVAERALVLLSANVFTAAYRAIALALAQTEDVTVRASRREPTMAELLHGGSGGAFALVQELIPRPGDHLWAYAADDTLEELRRSLPAGVFLHAHGAGMGIAVVAESGLNPTTPLSSLARELALDTVAFDQRGCLSPRAVLLVGSGDFCAAFADALAEELTEAERWVPRGPLNAAERAAAIRYEHTVSYVGGARSAGQGLVVLDAVPDRMMIAPVGRYLHLTQTTRPMELLNECKASLTTVGVFGDESLPGRIQACVGNRRVVDLGKMQTPPLDGPVDLRSGWTADQL